MGGGDTFWARIEAQKKAAAAAAVVPPPAVEEAPVGGGDTFWARIEAQKKAAASATSSPQQYPFVAPDGKGFHDQREFRKYVFETFYTFADRENETLVKRKGDIDGQAFNLYRLDHCQVQLLDHSDAMHVESLRHCKVFIAASCESVFLRDCQDCEFTIACKQLRTRDCSNCRISLYSKTDPIIETSTRLRFAPFTGACPRLDEVRCLHRRVTGGERCRFKLVRSYFGRRYLFLNTTIGGRCSISTKETRAFQSHIGKSKVRTAMERPFAAPP